MKLPNQLIKWAIFLFVTLPLVSCVSISSAIFVYIYWPTDTDSIILKDIQKKEHVFVLSHGLKDTPDTWAIELGGVLNKQFPQAQIIALNWEKLSSNALTCSVNGKRVGEEVANKLLTNPYLKSVHLIGHSCGSFVNWGACKVIKEKNQSIKVQTTYLDPVSIYGGVFWSYGGDKFGSCADFSDTYFDTDDNIPGSNSPLSNSLSIDVTQKKSTYQYFGKPHLWPTQYYLHLARKDRIKTLISDD